MNSGSDPVVVLIIEDKGDTRDQTQKILDQMGYRTLTADRYEAGLELIQKEPVGIVLLDLVIGQTHGMDTLRRIHKQHPHIPLIVISRLATVQAATDSMKSGAVDFIPKPFEPDQLCRAIGQAYETMRLDRQQRRQSNKKSKSPLDFEEEKSRYHQIIDSLPNGVLVTDADARAVLLNPAFCYYMGLPADTPSGMPVAHYIADEGLCALVTELSKGCHVDQDETPTYEFASDQRFLLARGRAVISPEQECLGAVVDLVDISAMKMIDRLKNEFVSKVSHELRSPLATIHEQLAVVLGDLAGQVSTADTHLLSRAKEKTEGLISLIGDLLDLSRIESGAVCQDSKPVMLDDLLENIIDFLSARALSKHHSLVFTRTKSDLTPVHADPLALESIFGNLITNAINYTPEGGRIEVKLEAADKHLEVQVIDNGFGIEERHQEKIFERFYRIKNEKTRYITGTGLGLPIVKGLVDALKGSISVRSKPDEGSIFTVRLPAGN